jgi:hypothetical protein
MQPNKIEIPKINVQFSYSTLSQEQKEHIYELNIDITNQGGNSVNNYKLEILFPDFDTIPRKWAPLFSQKKQVEKFITVEPSDQNVSVIHEPGYIRITYRSKEILFPKDNHIIGDKIGFRYLINQDIYSNIYEYPKIHWHLFADNYQPIEGSISVKELTNY